MCVCVCGTLLITINWVNYVSNFSATFQRLPPGYKQRWFRLKGNLLFYFRVDECGGWEVGDSQEAIVMRLQAIDSSCYDSSCCTV